MKYVLKTFFQLCIWSNLYAKLPFINDCQKSVCHFTDAKIQYAFLHKMPFYTTAFLHYCLLTPLPIYTTAFLHYCQYTGEPKNLLELKILPNMMYMISSKILQCMEIAFFYHHIPEKTIKNTV